MRLIQCYLVSILCQRAYTIPVRALIGVPIADQAQGGATAVEDGAALGVLFSNLTNKEEIPHRLQLFQQLRLDRVSAIEILSSVGQDEIHKVLDKARPFIKGPLPSKL